MRMYADVYAYGTSTHVRMYVHAHSWFKGLYLLAVWHMKIIMRRNHVLGMGGTDIFVYDYCKTTENCLQMC